MSYTSQIHIQQVPNPLGTRSHRSQSTRDQVPLKSAGPKTGRTAQLRPSPTGPTYTYDKYQIYLGSGPTGPRIHLGQGPIGLKYTWDQVPNVLNPLGTRSYWSPILLKPATWDQVPLVPNTCPTGSKSTSYQVLKVPNPLGSRFLGTRSHSHGTRSHRSQLHLGPGPTSVGARSQRSRTGSQNSRNALGPGPTGSASIWDQASQVPSSL
jgi:hypothetical protein